MKLKEFFKPKLSTIILTIFIYIIIQIILQSGGCLELAIISCDDPQEFIYDVPPIIRSTCEKCGTLGIYLFDQFLVWILPAFIAYLVSSVIIWIVRKIK